jgi:lipopolysaccharide/colanic/teichoic acid biosynthesis glycosyltransferase
MYKKIKRLLDIFFALIILIFLMPIFLIIALFIKLETYGPILYKIERVGKDGKIFNAYKFRTMHESLDYEHDKYIEKLIHEGYFKNSCKNLICNYDPRVTIIGRIIRKLNFDEFPQFFNIIKGDMSFIGPIYRSSFESKEYEEWERDIFKCRPGLTGLAQVNLMNNWEKYEDRTKMDLEYVRNESFFLDLKIFLKTIKITICKSSWSRS